MTKERYTNLDGLRAYACIGIILMHVNANGNFGLQGCLFERIIPSFTDFTYLFMMISAFSLCCGYYDRFISGNIDIERFYKKRYQRIWPFFALFCTLELAMDFSLNTVYEWFADLTLAFGLIPDNKIEVVGVGWFLGTIFVFYMIFPFFIFLISNKKRAWSSMVVVVILHALCTIRFTTAAGRENIIFSGLFFFGGGLLYLYRGNFERVKIPAVIIAIISALLYYVGYGREYALLIFYVMIISLCISCNGTASGIILRNKLLLFMASISMEVYLCHMFIYRTLEKFYLDHLLSDQLVNYMFDSAITIVGAIALAYGIRKILQILDKKVSDLVKKHENTNS